MEDGAKNRLMISRCQHKVPIAMAQGLDGLQYRPEIKPHTAASARCSTARILKKHQREYDGQGRFTLVLPVSHLFYISPSRSPQAGSDEVFVDQNFGGAISESRLEGSQTSIIIEVEATE